VSEAVLQDWSNWSKSSGKEAAEKEETESDE
jgi:hypothetical protein